MNASAVVAGRRWAVALTRFDLAAAAYGAMAVIMAWGLASAHDRPWAFVAIVPAGLAIAMRRRPLLGGALIGASATILRLGYVGIGYSTQVDHAQAAAARALEGLSPYGVLLPSATAPPEPFVYGPLALAWWQAGIAMEFAAAVGVTALLIGTRSWITLAVYSGFPFAVYLTTTGVNDYSPGLLIASGLCVLRTRVVLGAVLLAAAASLKPYAFAWFIPAVGYGGWPAAAALGAVTAALWSPLVAWGPESFVRSVRLNESVHPVPANTVNLPFMRWLAAPLTLLSLAFRSWTQTVLLGAAAFSTYLFFDDWASLGYWLAVIPAAGIAIEDRWARQ